MPLKARVVKTGKSAALAGADRGRHHLSFSKFVKFFHIAKGLLSRAAAVRCNTHSQTHVYLTRQPPVGISIRNGMDFNTRNQKMQNTCVPEIARFCFRKVTWCQADIYFSKIKEKNKIRFQNFFGFGKFFNYNF